ncbi:STAS domain-containing protein [Desulfobacterales bacterium HSG2]|nr:STAS domain-containing protein [Desulfobacterales bacterium HSG2]
MEISVICDGDKALFKIEGEIDEPGAEELKSRFRELNTSSLREATFDFRNVTHIGSAGIGKLLLFYKDLALNGGDIKIENVSETIRELFSVLKLDTIFTISNGQE